MSEGPNPENWPGNPRPFIDITGRKSATVENELSLDLKTIPPGATVVSFGEGFSDFAVRLQEKRPDISVVAIDRLYAHANPKDSPEEIKRKLKTAGFEPQVWSGNQWSDAPSRASTAEKQPLYIASDLYKLALADASVDVVYLNHVLEHIDFGKALPELLRVVKENGEIRFGGTPFTIKNKDGKFVLYLGTITRDTYDGSVLRGPDSKTFTEGLRTLAAEADTAMFTYLSQTDARPEGPAPTLLEIRTLVIKKGEQPPIFNEKLGALAGRTFRVLPNTLNSDDPRFPYVELAI